MQVFVTVLSVILMTSSLAIPTQNYSSVRQGPTKNCTQKDHTGCWCEMSDGSGAIDLRSIGYTNNKPRFKDYVSADGAKYSYNPCYGFTEVKCINSAVCMTHGKSMLSIGQADDVTMQYAPDLQTVVTTYFTNQTIVLEAEVVLVCDPNACDPVFDPIGVKAMGFYLFKMTSVCACPGLCTAVGAIKCKSSSGSLHTWSIICIGISVVLAAYIVCVSLFNKIRNKASCSDLILHKKFWSSLPGLIKDGFVFTFGCCLRNEHKYKRTAT